MSILEELYNGNIKFDSRHYEKDSPIMEAVRRRQGYKDKLMQQLTDNEKVIFEQYVDAESDVNDMFRYDLYNKARWLNYAHK